MVAGSHEISYRCLSLSEGRVVVTPRPTYLLVRWDGTIKSYDRYHNYIEAEIARQDDVALTQAALLAAWGAPFPDECKYGGKNGRPRGSDDMTKYRWSIPGEPEEVL